MRPRHGQVISPMTNSFSQSTIVFYHPGNLPIRNRPVQGLPSRFSRQAASPPRFGAERRRRWAPFTPFLIVSLLSPPKPDMNWHLVLDMRRSVPAHLVATVPPDHRRLLARVPARMSVSGVHHA